MDDWLGAVVMVGGPDIWGAARQGDLERVKQLVGQQPDLLNATDYIGATPLMSASQGGHVEIVRWQLDKGATSNQQNEWGTTALSFASSHGRAPS
jgi:ankyrin repeat protein